jgi:hypothetical protein
MPKAGAVLVIVKTLVRVYLYSKEAVRGTWEHYILSIGTILDWLSMMGIVTLGAR